NHPFGIGNEGTRVFTTRLTAVSMDTTSFISLRITLGRSCDPSVGSFQPPDESLLSKFFVNFLFAELAPIARSTETATHSSLLTRRGRFPFAAGGSTVNCAKL